jgi:hypothetical protein
MSTSLGRALRTALTLACALAALAVVAGPAMAEALLPATETQTGLIVLGGSEYDPTDNEYSINMGGQLSVNLGIAATGLESFAEAFPAELQFAPFCTWPEFAGVYGVIGLVDAGWRPSRGGDLDDRRSGLSKWANELGTASIPVSRDGCAGPTAPFPGQTDLNIDVDEEPFSGEFLEATTLTFCQEDEGYVLIGDSIGAGGRRTPYIVPSATGVWHFYTLGAFGTEQPANEQLVNLRFTGFPVESDPC